MPSPDVIYLQAFGAPPPQHHAIAAKQMLEQLGPMKA